MGTLYPLALEAVTDDKISVGAPFFDSTFAPIMVPLLIAVPFGPMLAWKRGDLLAAAQRLMAAAGIALAVMILVYAFTVGGPVLAPVGIGIGVWLILGAISEIAFRSKLFTGPLNTAFRRASGLPRSAWGTTLAHMGVGFTVIGIVSVTAYESETIVSMKPGETIDVAGYELTLEGFSPFQGPNYRDQVAHIAVREGGAVIGTLNPARRIYVASGRPTTETAIRTMWFSQLYVSLGEGAGDGGVAVRAYYKPFVTLIWLGAVVMVIGGIVSLSDRRLRVGAPRRARATSAPAPAE